MESRRPSSLIKKESEGASRRSSNDFDFDFDNRVREREREDGEYNVGDAFKTGERVER